MTTIIDSYTTPGTERETKLSPEGLLREMDAAGIGRAVVAPQDREIAVHNEEGNYRISDIARRSGGRFIPACSVNPWYGSEAISLLDEAAQMGARIFVLAPSLQGFILTDEIADELIARAGHLRLPVYIHTGPHCSAGPTQVVLIAQRFPETQFILGHGGTTDHAYDMAPILRSHRSENLWFELSFIRPWAIPSMLEFCGSDRFVYGSSAPRQSQAFELRHLTKFMPIEDYPGVYGKNLLRLLGEEEP